MKSALASAPAFTDWPNSNYTRVLDTGDVTVKPDGTTVARYRLTYKLFTERDRDRLAEVSLPFSSRYQTIHLINAQTIRKDGTAIKVKQDDVRVSSPYSDYLMYDDAQTVGFSMPAVEAGCIIDYTWEEVTRPMIMPGQFTSYWAFAGTEPVGVSKLTLHVPANKAMRFKVYNDVTIKPTVTTSTDGRTKTYTWERNGIKPLDIEPSMPHSEEIGSWMEVSSISSWQDIAAWFWGLEQPQAKPSDTIRATVLRLTAGKQNNDEKAHAIYDWVANHTRYVGLEFGISAYQPHAASDVHDKLYGDCKDKATLLITMLGLAGIPAHPVLLHAENRKAVDQQLPTLSAFNHCIALADINGKEVWLDATAETCAYGDIPSGDRGVRALVVRDGKGEFKTIPAFASSENGIDIDTHVNVQPDGSATTDMTITMRGAAGQDIRDRVRALTPDQRQSMMERMAQRFETHAVLKESHVPDGVMKEGPFVIKLTMNSPRFARRTRSGNLMFLPLEVGTEGSSHVNPFFSATRTWPVVEEDNSFTHSTTVISLPEGFTLEDAPTDVDLAGPTQEYRRALTRSDDGKTITVTSQVISKPGKIPASEYTRVKGYYDALIDAQEDQIVLKRLKEAGQ